MWRQLYALGVCSAVIGTSPAIVAAAEQAPPDLPRSNICAFNGARNVEGGAVLPTKGTMSNEGKWCWIMHWTAMPGRVVGMPMHVTTPPRHGEVRIDVFEKSTRIAYRPQPGFVGEDQFSVLTGMYNLDVPHFVTVQPDPGQPMFSRTVSAGTAPTVDHYSYLNLDCSFGGYADVKVRRAPSHGAVSIAPAEGYSSYPASNPRSACNRAKSKQIEITYTPAQGYTGADQFELFSTWPNGTTVSRLYGITVQ